jgi:tetratricopeptide (TPR) repeat protein
MLLANVQKAAKEFEPALDNYRLAAGLDPKDPRPLAAMGGYYYSVAAYAKAEEQLRAALNLDGDYGAALWQLAVVYSTQKRNADAIPYFQRAIEKEKSASKVATYRQAFGWSLLAEKRYAEAREQFTTAMQLDPKLQGLQEGLDAVKKAEQQGANR